MVVDLGPAYTANPACAIFVEFTTLGQRQQLLATLAGCRYFSLLVDASTDSGMTEEELFPIPYLDPHYSEGKVHTRNCFFTVK